MSESDDSTRSTGLSPLGLEITGDVVFVPKKVGKTKVRSAGASSVHGPISTLLNAER